MQISVTFRHVDPSEALKNYAIKKVGKLKKYLDGPVEAHVVLGTEKFRHQADITITSNSLKIKGKEETADMYSAIDMAMEKIEKQVRRLRDKPRHNKSYPNIKTMAALSDMLPGEMAAEDLPPVVHIEQVEAKPMDLEEAILQLNQVNEDILVFSNIQTAALNILYRRRDGSYGLIEPGLG
ncbi:MAG: ribosome-associated translation inhibitor RaiA [Deltaproteobacteria bacterium]|nr:ribosome-associated translation inhibitor RaiA [Deltaproteobacteria bacterium]MBW1953118.1 ribosome-associated translation inhibitor RaiA [Deltaproteobacteria bacterium]